MPTVGLALIHPQPFRLDEAAWFTLGEVARILGDPAHTPLRVQALMRTEQARSRAFAITRGNPLLVVLARTWLSDGFALEDMGPQKLLAQRAERVFKGLQAAGLTDSRLLVAMAAIALADGANRMRAEAVLSDVSLPTADTLLHIFPADAAEVRRGSIPAFRPEIIAEAVVRKVIQESQGGVERAFQIVRLAWCMSPVRLLRLRTRPKPANNPYNPAEPDPLSIALRDFDPVEAGASREEVVGADLDYALYAPPHDDLFPVSIDRRADIQLAISGVESLDHAGRERVLMRLLALLENWCDHLHSGLRVDAYLAFTAAAMAGGGDEPSAEDTAAVIEKLLSIDVRSGAIAEPAFVTFAAERFAKLLCRSPPSTEEQVLALAEDACRFGLHTDMTALMAALADAEVARRWRPVIDMMIANARGDLSFADRPLTDDPLVEATTLRYAAWAQAARPEGAGAKVAERLAGELRAIAARPQFTENSRIQDELARALRYSAFGQGQRPHGVGAEDAERLAGEVRAIAERPQFTENPSVHEELAHAFRDSAFGQGQRPHGVGAEDAERLAGEVRAIAERPQFTENPRIHEELASALSCAAFGQGQRPHGVGAEAAKRLAGEVRAIAERPQFTENPRIHEELANALRAAAQARGRRQ